MSMDKENGISDIQYDGMMRGIVKRRDDPKGQGRVAVYIPRLMGHQSQSAKPKENKIPPGGANYAETSEIKNAQIVNVSNYIWCRPIEYISDDSSSPNSTNGSYRVPQLEQTVFVFFEDSDPQKPYYYPFGPTKEGQVIPMENLEGSESNKSNVTNKPNIHVLSELPNGNIIGFDYNEGTNAFIIKFANGHYIRIVKGEAGNKIDFATEKGNMFEIDDASDNINLKVNNDFNQEIGNNLIIDAGNNANISIGSNATLKAGSNMILEAGSQMTLKAGSIIRLKAPKITKG